MTDGKNNPPPTLNYRVTGINFIPEKRKLLKPSSKNIKTLAHIANQSCQQQHLDLKRTKKRMKERKKE